MIVHPRVSSLLETKVRQVIWSPMFVTVPHYLRRSYNTPGLFPVVRLRQTLSL